MNEPHWALRIQEEEVSGGFTSLAAGNLHFPSGDAHFAAKIRNHLLSIRPLPPDAWVEIKPDFWRDEFGVVWNRTIDKDIGNEPSGHSPLRTGMDGADGRR